ncbi:MAG: HYR domain-containing protein, partial [Saprospiraceae bacterium]|nr:HYR domain-containing protein [Saprospiraceae bacterium]
MNSFFFNIQHRAGALRLCVLLLCFFAGRQTFASAPPNWTVDPGDYEFNLNVTAQASFEGSPSNASGSILGAFIGNELRGVANATIIDGEAYFFLTVYSNVYNGETVHFKLYHAPGDAIFPAIESVVFVHNASFGNVGTPFEINIDPNADFPPELLPILADTTLQDIPFETVDLANYLVNFDGDPVTYLLLPGPNLNASVANGILTVTPVSGAWIGTDSVRIIVRENTPAQLADTIWGLFTVLPDYGPPVWQNIPNQTIFEGQQFTPFDLDDFLNFNGPCHQFDFRVFPFTGSAPDPAWPVVDPGNQSMNIVARPLFANVQLAGAGAKLAAFVNGNLAGWATPSGVAPNVSYSLQLKNVGAGAITFRFYDATRQYLYEENTGLAFVAGGSVGTVASPYLIQLSPLLPSMAPVGQITVAIDDPTWMGSYPIDFIVWDCDYPNLRRDTFQAVFSIVNDTRPSITSPTAVNFEENACYTLYDTQSSDPNYSEGAGLSYTLDGGADVSRFAINAHTGILSWATGFSPNFENPQDANTNNKYLVTIKVTNGDNLSDTITLTVTITNQTLEPFAVTINGGSSLICTNVTADLMASGAVSYVWSTGSTLPTISVSAPGTYTVTGTSTGACTVTASIVVGPQVSITAMGSGMPICIGANIELKSTPAAGTTPYVSYTWAGPNGYSANVEDPAPFPATAGPYTVMVTDAIGCTASATTTISVSGNAAPTVLASSNTPVCDGASIVLSSTPADGSGMGYTFLWDGPNNYGAVGQNPVPFTAYLASAGTYSVTVTDNAGCTGTGSTSIQVNTKPTVVASSNSPVSVGGTIQLNAVASGGSGSSYTYLWAGPNNYSSTDAQPVGFTASLASSGVYSVTVTDGNGCTGTSTTTVIVVFCPTITASVNGATCEGGNISLQSTPLGGALPYASFVWAGPNGYSANVEDPAGFPASMSSNGIYTVTVTDQLGCSAMATVGVTVNPSPVLTAQNNGPICSGSTAVVSSSPSGGTPGFSFDWTGPDFFGAFVEDPAPFTATVAASGIYQVMVTDSKGCTATANTNLVVNAKPTVTASNNGPLCLDGTLDLQSNISGGSGVYTFNWTGPSSFTSTLEDPSRPMIQLTHAGTYNVTVTDITGCSSTASTSIAVSTNNAPSITAVSNSPLCAGSQLTLSSTPTAGFPPYIEFTWSGPNSYTSSVEDPAPFVILPNGAGIYTVTVTDTKNCKGTASVTVDVVGPALSPSSNSPVCPGATLQLNSGGPSGAGITYSWTGPNGYQSTDKDPAIPNATPAASGTYFVTVNDNGCLGLSSVMASVSDVVPPSITCPANTTLAADANCSSQMGSYNALSVSDNCNPNPAVTQSPASSTVLNGHNDLKTVTLTANDGNGNTASCSFTVMLKDVTKPSIACPANTTVAADGSCNGTVGAYAPATLSDNCSMNPTVTQIPASNTQLNGHNDFETVTFTADDGNGNSEFCTFTVTLKDVTPPSISCPANTTIAADGSCSGTVGAYLPISMSDNCNVNPIFSQNPALNTVLNGHNDSETVTLTANDGNGNSASCNFTVTLKDVTPPSVVCPANVTIAADASCSVVLGTYQAVSATDNCTANPTVSQSPASSTVLSGHNDVETVTLTADDGNGNTGVCTFIVMLKDVSPPVITCPANTTVA